MDERDPLVEILSEAFAEEVAPGPEDAAIVERLARRARAAPAEPRPTAQAGGAGPTLLTVAVLAVIVGGGAWLVGRADPAPRDDAPPSDHGATPPSRDDAPPATSHGDAPPAASHDDAPPPAGRRDRPEASPANDEASAPAPAPAPPATQGNHPAQAAAHRAARTGEGGEGAASRPTTEARPPSPAELLRRANTARRAGQLARADRLLRRLAQAHPGTREELLARVTHGRLLLDRLGDPAGALTRFDAYLAARPEGVLAEEALVGRARALAALGRAAEARTAWRALLDRYPDSAHAARARAALGAAP